MTDPSSKDNGNQSSGTLSASAIAGIAIGVFLIFFLAIALLIVHFRRERAFRRWEQNRYFDSYISPGAYSHQSSAMTHAYRRYYTGNAFSEKPGYGPAPVQSAGEYYDRMEAELRAASKLPVNHNAHHPAPQSNASSSVTAHSYEGSGYRSTSRSRSAGQITPARTPSPPAQVHRQRRSNTPDSFAIQAYLNAAEESARIATQRSPPLPPGQQPHDSEKNTSVVPSISLPHMPKLRLPKMYNPVKLFNGLRSSKNDRELVISAPLMTYDPRFHDIPMSGPVIISRERPPPLRNLHRHNGYIEVPLRSGKSTLYGY